MLKGGQSEMILARNHFNKWIYFLNCHINQPFYLIMASKKDYRLTIPNPESLFLIDMSQHSVNRPKKHFTHFNILGFHFSFGWEYNRKLQYNRNVPVRHSLRTWFGLWFYWPSMLELFSRLLFSWFLLE